MMRMKVRVYTSVVVVVSLWNRSQSGTEKVEHNDRSGYGLACTAVSLPRAPSLGLVSVDIVVVRYPVAASLLICPPDSFVVVVVLCRQLKLP